MSQAHRLDWKEFKRVSDFPRHGLTVTAWILILQLFINPLIISPFFNFLFSLKRWPNTLALFVWNWWLVYFVDNETWSRKGRSTTLIPLSLVWLPRRTEWRQKGKTTKLSLETSTFQSPNQLYQLSHNILILPRLRAKVLLMNFYNFLQTINL